MSLPAKPPKVELNVRAASRAGYAGKAAALVAARRALRWLRVPRNNGVRPPGHIQAKLQLLRLADG